MLMVRTMMLMMEVMIQEAASRIWDSHLPWVRPTKLLLRIKTASLHWKSELPNHFYICRHKIEELPGKGSASSSQLGHVVFRNIEPEVSTSLSRTFELCEPILQYYNTSKRNTATWSSSVTLWSVKRSHCGDESNIVGTHSASRETCRG